jgi:predicted XRE-type DNA-binding protein
MLAHAANILGMTDEIRAQLRQYLKDRNLSQAALAAQVETDRHTISRALASKRQAAAHLAKDA